MATNKLPEGSTWNRFVIQNVTENQEIRVTFAPDANSDGVPDKYQTVVVTASADGSGTVDPSKKEIALGEDLTFTVTPGEGQALYQVKNGDEILYTNTSETPFSGTFTASNILADMELTFVFSVDTDGDGIPDASETWYTITLNHDANTSIASNGVQGTVKVKIGQDCPIQFSALSGYAIDTVTIDDQSFINNGQTIPPNGTDWTSITLKNVQQDHTLSVTGAATTDDTGVADKYKLQVTPVVVGDDGGEVAVDPVLVVYGHNVVATITPDANMSVDSIESGAETYVNNPNFGKAIIENAEDVAAALEDPDIKELTLNAPIDITSEIQINKPMTIDGAGNTVTKSEPGKAFTMTEDSTIQDITIENTADNTEWNSSYGVQFYTGEHTVKNSTFTGGNAGIIANSATVNLEGTINVSGNTFGGIEVCRSQAAAVAKSTDNAALPAGVLNINGATIINDTEEYGKPTIWIDGNTDADGIVNGADAFTMIQLPHGDYFQKQFYLNEANSKPIKVGDSGYSTLDAAIAAAPASTETTIKLYDDITITGESVEIPANKNIKLDLQGHTIAAASGFTGRPITNKGTLTITGDGTITSENSGTNATGAVNNEGTLTIENGTFSGPAEVNGSAINNRAAGNLHIISGTFNGCPRGVQNLGTLVVDGGDFIGSDTYSGNEGNAIISGQGATTTINDGTFTGHMNAVSNMDNGGGCKLTVNGGTFTTDGASGSGAFYNGTGNTITIEDCQASTSGDSGSTLANRGTAIIHGGTFIGDNCSKQCYTVDSGQTSTTGASMELGENVVITGTFGALRAVSGSMTVKGGSYKVVDCDNHSGSDFYALYVASENGAVTVNIEDGTFESLSNDCVRVGNEGFDQAAVVNISGGSFTAPSGKEAVKVAGTGSASLTGGTYSSNVEGLVADNYQVNEVEGKFEVVATA